MPVAAIVMVLALAKSSSGDQGRVLNLGFADRSAWTVSADAPWWALVDIRDMLNLFHPFVVSASGTAAGAWRAVTIPAEWTPPFALRFYCADDYFADPEKHKPGQLGAESFFGHRFKQALIDGKVIWQRDVTDDNVVASQSVFQLDVTPYVAPAKPFRLTLRVLDKVATVERNARDVWFIPGTWYAPGESKVEQPPRFHTSVWFADAMIGEKSAVEAAPPGSRPHEAVVAARHRARWPLPPLGDAMPRSRLKLVTPAAIPAPGYPITCGIPMPPGALRDPQAVRLRYRQGEAPVQTQVTGRWPDGSIRWLLLTVLAPAGASPGEAFRLDLNNGPSAAPATPVTVRRRGAVVAISTGAIRISLGRDPEILVDSVFLAGNSAPALTGLAARMSVVVKGATAPVTARWQRVEIVDRGPVAARIELRGSLYTARAHTGRFTFRLYAYAGLPTIQTQFRVINDVKPEPWKGSVEDAPLEVADLALTASVPGSRDKVMVGGDGAASLDADRAVSLHQASAERFVVTRHGAQLADGKRAAGWIAARGAGACVQASVWRFWQQYPKSLKADARGIEIGLFAPSEAAPRYRPRFGEAKRHEIWFTFSPTGCGRGSERTGSPSIGLGTVLGLLADQPPRLFDGDWFCRSGGVNLLDPQWFARQPKLAQWVDKSYGNISTARVTGHFGIRDFGDMPYGSQGQWFNGYWAMVQGALNWGLASGDQRWIERSFEIARHIADVDSVHIAPGHGDWSGWEGATCALGTDHSVHNGLALWPAFQIGESLVLHYWMTGDPDSLDAAVANADLIIRTNAGVGSVEARSQARPLLTLLRVWQATGKRSYRDAARRYLDRRRQVDPVIDWRRGAYIQPTYENYRCISAGLDSMYAENVYEYYRLTGDVGAAQLVVALADSIYAESMLPQEEGLGSFLYYVRYSRNSWYYPQMALLFHMAYDLTEDLRFLRAGRAAFARYLVCNDGSGTPMYQPFMNFGWLEPEFGAWQRRCEGIATAPADIKTQTPEPDPAQYQ
jgi:hypothetical protein